MASLIISTWLVLLLGYLLIDEFEYADESILHQLRLGLSREKPAHVDGDDKHDG